MNLFLPTERPMTIKEHSQSHCTDSGCDPTRFQAPEHHSSIGSMDCDQEISGGQILECCDFQNCDEEVVGILCCDGHHNQEYDIPDSETLYPNSPQINHDCDISHQQFKPHTFGTGVPTNQRIRICPHGHHHLHASNDAETKDCFLQHPNIGSDKQSIPPNIALTKNIPLHSHTKPSTITPINSQNQINWGPEILTGLQDLYDTDWNKEIFPPSQLDYSSPTTSDPLPLIDFESEFCKFCKYCDDHDLQAETKGTYISISNSSQSKNIPSSISPGGINNQLQPQNNHYLEYPHKIQNRLENYQEYIYQDEHSLKSQKDLLDDSKNFNNSKIEGDHYQGEHSSKKQKDLLDDSRIFNNSKIENNHYQNSSKNLRETPITGMSILDHPNCNHIHNNLYYSSGLPSLASSTSASSPNTPSPSEMNIHQFSYSYNQASSLSSHSVPVLKNCCHNHIAEVPEHMYTTDRGIANRKQNGRSGDINLIQKNYPLCRWENCDSHISESSQLESHLLKDHLLNNYLHSDSQIDIQNIIKELLSSPKNHTQEKPIDSHLPTTINPFQCEWDKCNYQSENLKTLIGHMQESHGIANLENTVLAPLDGMDITSSNLLLEHVTTSSSFASTSVPNKPPGTYPQPETAKLDPNITQKIKEESKYDFSIPFNRRSNTKYQREPPNENRCKWVHSNGELCNKLFDTELELSEHVCGDHVGSRQKEYICCWKNCERYQKPFKQRQKILRHLHIHTNYKPFKCNFCVQCFAEEALLKQHMRIHSGEKPFKCTLCAKSFAASTALSVHMRTHTGEKPLICKWPGCGKRFSESSNLAKHMRTHKAEKIYICPYDDCKKSFVRNDQLQRHLLTHNKSKSNKSWSKEKESSLEIENSGNESLKLQTTGNDESRGHDSMIVA